MPTQDNNIADFETLLSISPTEAIVKMFNYRNDSRYRMDRFTVSEPEQIAFTKTKVKLLPNPPVSPYDDFNIKQPVEVTYDRINLPVFFQYKNLFLPTFYDNVVGQKAQLPYSTQDILNEFTKAIGQKFYIDDIILEEVTRDNGTAYFIKAKPGSLRFIGQVEIPVIDTKDFSSIISPSLTLGGELDERIIYPVRVAYGYVNGTRYKDLISGLNVGDTAQLRTDLLTLFKGVVPYPGIKADFQYSLWHVTPAETSDFNLYNAKVVNKFSDYTSLYGFSGINACIQVELDGQYCANFKTSTLTIGYCDDDFNTQGFTDTPRLTFKYMPSVSDGSQWNVDLNELEVGKLTSIPSSMTPDRSLDEGTNAWVFNDYVRSPYNLTEASVTYNGQLRENDPIPATKDLDRVVEFDLTVNNSIYKDKYPIYYNSPIKWNVQQLNGVEQTYFLFDFEIEDDDIANYNVVIDYGKLPSGLSLHDGKIEGTPDKGTEGVHKWGIIITRLSDDVSVDFDMIMVVDSKIAPLELVGDLPDAVLGFPYTNFINIKGGQPPYTNKSVVPGNIPRLSINYRLVEVEGNWVQKGSYDFTMKVRSSDGQTISKNFHINVSTTHFPIEVTNTFNNGIINQAYESSIGLSGGDRQYQTPEVIAGRFPHGLAYDIEFGTNIKLTLSGTPTEEGVFFWTTRIIDGEGSRLTFERQMIVTHS